MGGFSVYVDASPVHSVTLSSFEMGATPVTVALWREYCVATSKQLPKSPRWGLLSDHPVVYVSWDDIMGPNGFCAWASSVSGASITLPTEAQYEYAARGGGSLRTYPWGTSFDRRKLWCSSRGLGDSSRTASVKRKTNVYNNGFGLRDLVGNVS